MNSDNLQKITNFPNCVTMFVWKLLKKKILHHTCWRRKTRMRRKIYVESTHYLEKQSISSKIMDPWKHEDRSNVRNHSCWKRRSQSYRETCGKATTKAYCDTVSHFYSSSGKKVDRHQNRKIRFRLSGRINSYDQIVAKWCINSLRRWLSSRIWRHSWKNYILDSAMLCNVKGRRPKKDFNMAWILTLPNTSCVPEQFKNIQEVILWFLH